jgi:hypothetical protein
MYYDICAIRPGDLGTQVTGPFSALDRRSQRAALAGVVTGSRREVRTASDGWP